jgi:sodium/potassium/calcium exchanger 6
MSFNQFGCERIAIESVRRFAQRNILIAEYCSENFAFMNLVDLYYRATNENAILIFIFICGLFPILFMCIAAVADKYLANGMKDLSERFGLSPTIAAMTLLAFANGAPDILGALGSAGKAGGALISVGSLAGAFLFSTCLVSANVIMCSTDNVVHLPKTAVIKELVFYLIAVCVIILFGFIKTAGYPFVITYFLCYGAYVATTIVLEKKGKEDEVEKELDELDNENNASLHEEGTVDEENNGSKQLEEIAEDKKEDTKEFNVAEVEEEEEVQEKGLIGQMCDEMFEEENSLLENIILGPLMLAGMFTNCYLDNPIMKLPVKYAIIANSFVFMVVFLELADVDLKILFLIGYGLGALFLVLELVKVRKFYLEIFYELISVLAAIGWISIFAGLVIDCISFLAFYFSINEVILATLLLSAGNTVGDYFGNGALAKTGEEIMAMMGVYSGQLFNNFVGFGAVMFASTNAGITDFDIFALDWKPTLSTGESVPYPVGSYFLMMVFGFVIVDIILSLAIHSVNKFVATKSFSNVMVPFYGVFFVVSLTFGVLSRGM